MGPARGELLGQECGYETQSDYAESHACSLHFKCTNNLAEYEALILGLNLLRKLGAHRINVYGDSKLIIK